MPTRASDHQAARAEHRAAAAVRAEAPSVVAHDPTPAGVGADGVGADCVDAIEVDHTIDSIGAIEGVAAIAGAGANEVGGSVDPSATLDVVWSWVQAAAGADPVAAAAAAARLTAWSDSRRLAAIARLQSTPGRTSSELLHDGLTSSSELARAERRADAVAALPAFGAALAGGLLTSSHVDRLAEALRRLTPAQRAELARIEAVLVRAATQSTATGFAREVNRHATRIINATPRPDGADPEAEGLARQRAQVRLVRWTDRDTGMVLYRLALDPLAATALDRRIGGRTEALFHGGTRPDGCPADAIERQQFLDAHALLSLTTQPAAGGTAEVIVVVDHTAPGPEPDVDWGHPDVRLPHEELERLLQAPGTQVHEVVVRNGVVIRAPGHLDLGRSTRLANRHQRRALRALYRTCAVPGCDVEFDRCVIHHLQWWRHLGRTDLHNLLPLCTRHHTAVHHQGWRFQMDANRRLTIQRPHAPPLTTEPPRRWAA